VTSKNISLTEDVYEMLSKLKLEGESFSDAIRRLAKRNRLSECAGLWADMDDEEYQAIRSGSLKARAVFNESMRGRVEAP
jgi:predicted CopG family antitoxin